MGMKKYAAAPTATLALVLFFTPTVSIAKSWCGCSAEVAMIDAAMKSIK
jgi:hypothetical protein